MSRFIALFSDPAHLDSRASLPVSAIGSTTLAPALAVGASVVAVATRTVEAAEPAIELINLEREPLPFIVDMEDVRDRGHPPGSKAHAAGPADASARVVSWQPK